MTYGLGDYLKDGHEGGDHPGLRSADEDEELVEEDENDRDEVGPVDDDGIEDNASGKTSLVNVVNGR